MVAAVKVIVLDYGLQGRRVERLSFMSPIEAISWRVGQRLRMRYYGYIGELISATLLNPDGTPAGIRNRAASFSRAVSVVLGLFTTWAVVKRYRRYPEAAEDSVGRSSSSSNTVDQDSLLHLTEDRSSERP